QINRHPPRVTFVAESRIQGLFRLRFFFHAFGCEARMLFEFFERAGADYVSLAHCLDVDQMMRLRRRERISAASLRDFKACPEPRSVRGANRIRIEARVRPDSSRARSAIAEMNRDNGIRLAWLNEDRRNDFASLISQLYLVGDYLASDASQSIRRDVVD